jgi:hypothetical protein
LEGTCVSTIEIAFRSAKPAQGCARCVRLRSSACLRGRISLISRRRRGPCFERRGVRMAHVPSTRDKWANVGVKHPGMVQIAASREGTARS